MNTRTEIEGLFTFQCEYSTLPALTPEQRADVENQLKIRYFSTGTQHKPTKQEQKWGIKRIYPDGAYWFNFKQRLPEIIEVLKDDPNSNRAVIVIDCRYQPPCYPFFQWKICRNPPDKVFENHLDLTCFARSLDLKEGLPVDAHIFWKAGLEPVVKALGLEAGTLRIVSIGAHKYG